MLRHPIYPRWADIDLLQHVNNVKFGEWAHEGLLAAQRAQLVASVEPTRCHIDFLRPVLPGLDLLWIDTEVDGTHLDQTLTDDETIYARIATELAPITDSPVPLISGTEYLIYPRRAEARADKSVAYSRIFEYLQEARVETFTQTSGGSLLGTIVIARIEASFFHPLLWREEPYEAMTAATRIGNSSIELTTQIIDNNRVLVEAVTTTVAFDLNSQQSRPLTDVERKAYEALLI